MQIIAAQATDADRVFAMATALSLDGPLDRAAFNSGAVRRRFEPARRRGERTCRRVHRVGGAVGAVRVVLATSRAGAFYESIGFATRAQYYRRAVTQ